jgi:ribosomal-protein-alanine N-acetyltransferase
MTACIITTERLCLRQWIESDNKPFAEMNRDLEVMKYFPAVLTADETLAMINRIHLSFSTKGFGLFAVEQRSAREFLGFTGFSVPRFESFFTPCVEIGWRYKKESWGKGFAAEAAAACIQYGFEHLGFEKIVSFTSILNKPSEKLMQRTGMSRVAEFHHPGIEKASPLCRHVLYEIKK